MNAGLVGVVLTAIIATGAEFDAAAIHLAKKGDRLDLADTHPSKPSIVLETRRGNVSTLLRVDTRL